MVFSNPARPEAVTRQRVRCHRPGNAYPPGLGGITTPAYTAGNILRTTMVLASYDEKKRGSWEMLKLQFINTPLCLTSWLHSRILPIAS